MVTPNRWLMASLIACCAASCMVSVSVLSGCGKKEAPVEKTAEQFKAEREASAAKARESAVFGSQLQSMDKAKATADEAAKVAAERAKQANQ